MREREREKMSAFSYFFFFWNQRKRVKNKVHCKEILQIQEKARRKRYIKQARQKREREQKKNQKKELRFKNTECEFGTKRDKEMKYLKDNKIESKTKKGKKWKRQ